MKTELFKKVYVRSIDDLPEDEGYYFVGIKGNYDRDIDIYRHYKDIRFMEEWVFNVDWYLTPVKITDLKIEL